MPNILYGRKSCGRPTRDYTGIRKGMLTFIEPTGEARPRRGAVWTIQCDCGKVIERVAADVMHNGQVSCGCQKKRASQKNIRHAAKFGSYHEGTELSQIAKVAPNRNNKSGYRGVNFDKKIGKYKAQIKFKGMIYYLGAYRTAQEASDAYMEAKARLHLPVLKNYGYGLEKKLP